MIDVIYVDNHVLVVNKPHGVLSQADVTGDDDMLSAGKRYLKERYAKPGNVFLGLVHRLDRPASGVMVFARTSKSASRLGEQFRLRQTEKRYVAIVEGRPELTGDLRDFLKKFGPGDVRVVQPHAEGGQEAVMRIRTLKSLRVEDHDVSLVEIELDTGRPHQIRVQLASRGHPIVGDLRYGARSTFDGQNLALHAWQLKVEHPTLRSQMCWVARPSVQWDPWFGKSVDRLLDGADDQSSSIV